MAAIKHLSVGDFWCNFDTFLFDADGVLWRERDPINGAIALIQSLLVAKKRVLIVTNNATKDAREYLEKCHKLGFKGLQTENIVGSGIVLAHQLRKMKANPQFAATAHLPIYLFGSYGLQRLLAKEGIQSFGPGPDPIAPEQEGFISHLLNLDLGVPRPFAVVGGFDVHMSYAKVMRAANWLRDPSIPFMVTNEDATFPGPDPEVTIPGAGSVTSVLRFVSGREPEVMGKPSPICWDYICEQFPKGEIDPRRTLMIGDRCETDIQFGRTNGLGTMLVLTGIHSLADAEQFATQGRQELVPEFFANSLAELIPAN